MISYISYSLEHADNSATYKQPLETPPLILVLDCQLVTTFDFQLP